MFRPASKLPYQLLAPDAQVLVVTEHPEAPERWAKHACALLFIVGGRVRDVVRDLLYNPHVRAVVFFGPCKDREAFDGFWSGTTDTSSWAIEDEHLTLVRQFVDLFDEDYVVRRPLQPFWPARIYYPN